MKETGGSSRDASAARVGSFEGQRARLGRAAVSMLHAQGVGRRCGGKGRAFRKVDEVEQSKEQRSLDGLRDGGKGWGCINCTDTSWCALFAPPPRPPQRLCPPKLTGHTCSVTVSFRPYCLRRSLNWLVGILKRFLPPCCNGIDRHGYTINTV